jgi:hypothetical protein
MQFNGGPNRNYFAEPINLSGFFFDELYAQTRRRKPDEERILHLKETYPAVLTALDSSIDLIAENPLDFHIERIKSRLRRLGRYAEKLTDFETSAQETQRRSILSRVEQMVAIHTIECPSCYGAGTRRWMVSYKEKCAECGGAGRVTQ